MSASPIWSFLCLGDGRFPYLGGFFPAPFEGYLVDLSHKWFNYLLLRDESERKKRIMSVVRSATLDVQHGKFLQMVEDGYELLLYWIQHT